MKLSLILVTLMFAFPTLGQIVNPSEQTLNEDLNFKLVEEEEKNRQIASDKNDKDEKDSEESERDIASEADEQSNKIQYWKY